MLWYNNRRSTGHVSTVLQKGRKVDSLVDLPCEQWPGYVIGKLLIEARRQVLGMTIHSW